MGFSELREALTNRAFETFGDPAEWSGVGHTVMIRPKGRDEDDRFGQVRVVTRSTIIRVRRSEVPQPEVGDVVAIAVGRLVGRYVVRRGSMLDDKGVWDCPVDAAP